MAAVEVELGSNVTVAIGVSATSASPPPQATRATNEKQTSNRSEPDRVDVITSRPSNMRANVLCRYRILAKLKGLKIQGLSFCPKNQGSLY